LSTTIVYNEINGVELNLLSLDIYYNELTENKKPVVIWVHGGGWGAGDKSNQIENKVDLFQSLDYVLVSVNYRLSPFPFELDNPDRLMYPNHNNDVADAIKWVVDNINQYGGDLDRIALLGHSAGAHLVSLTATNSSFLENVGLGLANIKGVAAIDTEGYDVLGRVEENNSLYINAFGVNTDSNLQASPIYTIESGVSYPNFFVAKRGSSETIAIADNFINTLESNGVFVSQIDGSIYDHNGINNAIGELNETLVTNALKDFFAVSFQ
jgi:acetyl esterase/lipase